MICKTLGVSIEVLIQFVGGLLSSHGPIESRVHRGADFELASITERQSLLFIEILPAYGQLSKDRMLPF